MNGLEATFDGQPVLQEWLPFVNEENVSGVESSIDFENGRYDVYNLQGIKVVDKADKSQVNTLAKGMYIINGKLVKF